MVVQAGSSETGRELAAETADVVFTAQTSLAKAQAFYADLKGRLARFGRREDELKIMPGAFVVIGASEAEAKEKFEQFQALVEPASASPCWGACSATSTSPNTRWTARCPSCR